MILHDPHRPRLFHKPAFLNGTHVIPHLQIFPESDDGSEVSISLMLPFSDERFVAHWRTIRAYTSDVPDLIIHFNRDPEEFVRIHFETDVMKFKIPSHLKTPDRTKPEPSSFSSQSSMEDLLT